MGTVFKREWHSYTRSPLAWGFWAILLLVSGLLVLFENLLGGSPNIEYTLLGGEYALMVLIPLLAMGSMAKDNRDGTAALYAALPLSRGAVVMGKYLALLAVFAVPCGVLALYPILFGLMGSVPYLSAYLGLLCFFCLGAALLAICQFLSSLTKRPWVAGVVGIVTLAVFYLLPVAGYLLPNTALMSFIGLVVLALLCSLAAFGATKNLPVAFVTGAVLIIPLSILYIVKGEAMAGALVAVLEAVSPFLRCEDILLYGIFSLPSLLVILSYAVFFVFLTWRVSAERYTQTRSTRPLFWGAGTLAALVLVNGLVGLLPAKATLFDSTGLGMTEISDETDKFLAGLDQDVSIYWLCEGGVVDDQMDLLLTRYAEASDHVTVQVVDTEKDPGFAAAHGQGTLNNFSLIVESGDRAQSIDATDLYYYTNDFVTQMLAGGTERPLTLGELQQLNYYYGDYMKGYKTHIYFDGEALLTSTIDYVTTPILPGGYLITGHGDTAPSKTLSGLLAAMGTDLRNLDLTTLTAVPADAGCVVLFAPTTDLSEHEATLLEAYTNRGGTLILITSPETVTTCPRIMSLGAAFGLSAQPGLVKEGDLEHTDGNSTDSLLPDVNSQHAAASYVSSSGFKVQMPRSHAIAVAEKLPTGVTATPMFTTSEKATRVDLADVSTTLGEAGKHHVAVSARKTVPVGDGTTTTADLTWFASANAFTDAVADKTSGGTYYYLAASVIFTAETFTSAYNELPAVDLSSSALSLTTASVVVLGILVVAVIPLGLLATGLAGWQKRRRR